MDWSQQVVLVIAPEADYDIVGIRPGEKRHVLISEDEARSTVEREDMSIVKPAATLWQRDQAYDGQPLPDGFRYASDNNPVWLTEVQIREIVAPIEKGTTLQEAVG